MKSFAQLLQHLLWSLCNGSGFGFDQNKGDDAGEIAHGVYQKTGALSHCGDQYAGNGGADQPRAVDHRGVQGDGVAEYVLVLHYVHDKGLPGSDVESGDEAQKHTQHGYMPNLDDLQ